MRKNWYHMGIDGGGTQCRARLYTPDGELIGSAKAGPANVRLGSKRVKQSLNDVATAVLAQANLEFGVLQDCKVGLGLAGVVSDSDIERYSEYCKIFPHAALQSDSYIACLGAHEGEDGATLVTGTGTSIMLIQQGVPHIICSWGFRVGDQASGAHMGLLAIRTALKAHDGIIPETDFSRALMSDFNHTPGDLVNWSDTATPSDYAQYAPLIIEASKAHDPIARYVTDQCFSDFRDIVDMLINKGASKISLIGGLSDVYRSWLPKHYQAYLRAPISDPIDGAVILAKQIPMDD